MEGDLRVPDLEDSGEMIPAGGSDLNLGTVGGGEGNERPLEVA
jgi:hypothetical protein